MIEEKKLDKRKWERPNLISYPIRKTKGGTNALTAETTTATEGLANS